MFLLGSANENFKNEVSWEKKKALKNEIFKSLK